MEPIFVWKIKDSPEEYQKLLGEREKTGWIFVFSVASKDFYFPFFKDFEIEKYNLADGKLAVFCLEE